METLAQGALLINTPAPWKQGLGQLLLSMCLRAWHWWRKTDKQNHPWRMKCQVFAYVWSLLLADWNENTTWDFTGVSFSLCLHLWLRSHLGEVWESWYRPVIILLQINSKSFGPECPHRAWGESANNRIAMMPFIYPVLCSWPSINQATTPCSSKWYVGMTNHSQFLEDMDSKRKETLTS